MNLFEYGSIQIQSPAMISVLEQINVLSNSEQPPDLCVVLGEIGVGKFTMAQHIQKTVYKSKDILILKNPIKDIQINCKPCLVTTNFENWEDLKSLMPFKKATVITMPSLKDRKKDIQQLAEFFLQVISLMQGHVPLKLSEKAHERILQHNWPGNFYEFENTLEAAFKLAIQNSSQLTIEPQHLNLSKTIQNLKLNVGMKLEEVERNFILQTLYFVHQNRTKAAEVLGISIRTLRNKINQYRQEGYL